MAVNLEDEGNDFKKLLDFEKLATDFMKKCTEDKNLEKENLIISTTDMKDILNIYKRKYHDNIKFYCTLCEFETNKQFSLKRHKQNVHENVPYPCEVCNKIFKSLGYFEDHRLRVHDKREFNKIKFHCTQCEFETNKKFNLKRHKQNVHESLANSLLLQKSAKKEYDTLENKVKCKACSLELTSQRCYFTHMYEKHGECEIQCPHCEYKSAKKLNFNRHILKHQKDRVYTKTCKFCGKAFSSTFSKHRLLRHHINKEHLKIKYFCDPCNYTTDRKDNLNIHKRKYHEKIRFHCTLCEYEAKRKDNLKRHVKSFHENLTYPCELCGKIFKNMTTLKGHRLVVHEKQGYKCDDCDYRVKGYARLKEHHDSVHKKLRYPCDQCIFQAASFKTLKDHISAKHDGAKFNCDQCDLIVTSKAGLRQHKRRKHFLAF